MFCCINKYTSGGLHMYNIPCKSCLYIGNIFNVIIFNVIIAMLPKHVHHFHFYSPVMFCMNDPLRFKILSPVPQSATSHCPSWTSPAISVARISQHLKISKYTIERIPGWSFIDVCSVTMLSLSWIPWTNTNWPTLGRNFLIAQLAGRLSLSHGTWRHIWKFTLGRRTMDVFSVTKFSLQLATSSFIVRLTPERNPMFAPIVRSHSLSQVVWWHI